MNDVVLNEIRSKYMYFMDKNEELVSMKNRINELEGYDLIKEYMYLKNEYETNGIRKEIDILRLVFDKEIISGINSNIYIYGGAYMYDPIYGVRIEYRCYDEVKANYLLYINLGDSLDIKYISPSYRDLFEKDKVIIKFNPYTVIDREYNKIQEFYYMGLMNGLNEDEILDRLSNDMIGSNITSIKKNNENIKVKTLERSDYDE